MRIVHIVGSLEARHGGPSRSVRRLATATAELGHDVELLTSAPEAAATEQNGRLAVRTWRRRWPAAICRVPEMAAHLDRAPADVVHHHGLWLRTLDYARAKSSRAGIPLVISPRGMMSPWAWQHRRARKIFAARWLHPRALHAAHGWHVTSSDEAEEVRARGFTQPVCIAPNGVDQPDPAATAAAAVHWRSRVPATAGRRVALFYSRFHEKKRVRELIELWRNVGPADWLLLLVGVPEQYSVQQLRAEVTEAGAAGRIEVHDGTEAAAPYALASLFLLPSRSENFGLVIAEAMAHGIPAIVTDMTPWSALNTHGHGWCVPWAAFGGAIKQATGEPAAQLAARGEGARKWVLREFSWQRCASQLVALYGQLKKPIS